MITKDYLEQQLHSFQQDLIHTKEHLLRVDGAIELAKHLLADFADGDETPMTPAEVDVDA